VSVRLIWRRASVLSRCFDLSVKVVDFALFIFFCFGYLSGNIITGHGSFVRGVLWGVCLWCAFGAGIHGSKE
jgi:hypothetical protein